MDSEPCTISPQSSIQTAMEMLVSFGKSFLFVVDDNLTLLGVIPDYELLKARMTGIELSDPVQQLLCYSVNIISPLAPLPEAASLLRESRYRHFAVVDQGVLVGEMSRERLLEWIVTMDRLNKNISSWWDMIDNNVSEAEPTDQELQEIEQEFEHSTDEFIEKMCSEENTSPAIEPSSPFRQGAPNKPLSQEAFAELALHSLGMSDGAKVKRPSSQTVPCRKMIPTP